MATMGNLALEKFNRYQLGCGGVLDELKQMLLDDANSDAFKAQCLRVAALIVSTNNPTGEAVAAHPCHNFHCLTPAPSTGDDFATKFASRSML